MHEFNDNNKHYPNMMHNYSRLKAKKIVDVNNQKMPHRIQLRFKEHTIAIKHQGIKKSHTNCKHELQSQSTKVQKKIYNLKNTKQIPHRIKVQLLEEYKL